MIVAGCHNPTTPRAKTHGRNGGLATVSCAAQQTAARERIKKHGGVSGSVGKRKENSAT